MNYDVKSYNATEFKQQKRPQRWPQTTYENRHAAPLITFHFAMAESDFHLNPKDPLALERLPP